ncbi:MAG: ATP-binding protein [Verrucomicrobiota bacterium]|nr:ATP-binding protein [Verrucomicrobiota bacterium]
MLSSFYIQNFRSILELKLDFTYGEGKAPNGYKGQEVLPFIEAGNKQRFVPCMAFFGANASGKTNLLKALAVFQTMVREGAELPKLFEPNLLNPKFSNTTFALVFILSGACFEYRVSYNATEIQEEALHKNGKALFSIHHLKTTFSAQIVSPSYSEAKLSDILHVECSDGEGRQTKLFLNRIGIGYPGLDSDLRSAFAFFTKSITLWMNRDDIPLNVAVEVLASAMNGDEKAALLEITEVVRRLDIDIVAIDIARQEIATNEAVPHGIMTINRITGTRHSLKITATHNDISGTPAYLDFLKHESAGTQRLAGLVGIVLHALKTGSVLVVDELECSLHPLLIKEIVMLFKKHRHNPHGAQLIVTTHNTDILDDSILRLSEIALVRKTTANGTLVRRLIDAKNDGEDMRNVTNFRKQYLAGYYSAIPHPAL